MSDVDDAHRHSSRNSALLADSAGCGCFYCLAIYPPSEIADWTDGGRTALCPRCGIDSVIADRSGYPVTRQFLEQMHARWF
ncbi:cytoplasmic protein [Mycolicibacterium nivoides]|jgi:hypothetical protein|uniref:Cytoplasmic protein n=1 Tax=Mycolicibacterium nivoides TaxID=2487344 RepID=A0ABW9LI44_9MYCO|nr:cytoplasmic protein [Mycolicibacterium nivoides]MBN3510938.1 cytoplasmic protein [Mycolicibacterium septicum]SER13749.1 hypothetical protein SAMN04488583_4429 [Mycobacterium sp. 88mf]SFF82782.1 hypothetical protein SAMN04488582_104235 [Mycobacterium sp. 455mf]